MMLLKVPGEKNEGCFRYKYNHISFVFGGVPGEILSKWINGKFELIVSHEILEEYREVSDILKQKYPKIEPEPILNLITLKSTLTFSVLLKEQVCEDPDDDKFIACALASNAKIIVSGDKHLLNVNGYRKLKILKPKEFLKEKCK